MMSSSAVAKRPRDASCLSVVYLQQYKTSSAVSCCYYGRPLSVSGRPCYILPMFLFIYFMAALFSGPGERRFAKVLHVVDLSVIREVTT